MKLQDTLFGIKKISYPNSNTRHGKCRIYFIPQQDGGGAAALSGSPVIDTYVLQMVKECAQIMAHERLLFSSIRQLRINAPIIPKEHPHIMIEIHLNQFDKEGTGLVYRMKAVCTKMGGGDSKKFFDLAAELSPVR